MEIKPIINREALGSMAPASLAARKQVEGQKDSVAFREANGLDHLIQQAPAVRVGTVERARDQISQIGWPPAVAIRQISDLLAVNLYQKN